jgi:hypothetical protein
MVHGWAGTEPCLKFKLFICAINSRLTRSLNAVLTAMRVPAGQNWASLSSLQLSRGENGLEESKLKVGNQWGGSGVFQAVVHFGTSCPKGVLTHVLWSYITSALDFWTSILVSFFHRLGNKVLIFSPKSFSYSFRLSQNISSLCSYNMLLNFLLGFIFLCIQLNCLHSLPLLLNVYTPLLLGGPLKTDSGLF